MEQRRKDAGFNFRVYLMRKSCAEIHDATRRVHKNYVGRAKHGHQLCKRGATGVVKQETRSLRLYCGLVGLVALQFPNDSMVCGWRGQSVITNLPLT